MTKPLFIAHQLPSPAANELLDALLVAAAFGLEPAVLFQGDGVWQLLRHQHGKAWSAKSLAAQWQALPLYDVNDIYVDAQSLQLRGLSPADLVLDVQLITTNDISALYARHQPLLRF